MSFVKPEEKEKEKQTKSGSVVFIPDAVLCGTRFKSYTNSIGAADEPLWFFGDERKKNKVGVSSHPGPYDPSGHMGSGVVPISKRGDPLGYVRLEVTDFNWILANNPFVAEEIPRELQHSDVDPHVLPFMGRGELLSSNPIALLEPSHVYLPRDITDKLVQDPTCTDLTVKTTPTSNADPVYRALAWSSVFYWLVMNGKCYMKSDISVDGSSIGVRSPVFLAAMDNSSWSVMCKELHEFYRVHRNMGSHNRINEKMSSQKNKKSAAEQVLENPLDCFFNSDSDGDWWGGDEEEEEKETNNKRVRVLDRPSSGIFCLSDDEEETRTGPLKSEPARAASSGDKEEKLDYFFDLSTHGEPAAPAPTTDTEEEDPRESTKRLLFKFFDSFVENPEGITRAVLSLSMFDYLVLSIYTACLVISGWTVSHLPPVGVRQKLLFYVVENVVLGFAPAQLTFIRHMRGSVNPVVLLDEKHVNRPNPVHTGGFDWDDFEQQTRPLSPFCSSSFPSSSSSSSSSSSVESADPFSLSSLVNEHGLRLMPLFTRSNVFAPSTAKRASSVQSSGSLFKRRAPRRGKSGHRQEKKTTTNGTCVSSIYYLSHEALMSSVFCIPPGPPEEKKSALLRGIMKTTNKKWTNDVINTLNNTNGWKLPLAHRTQYAHAVGTPIPDDPFLKTMKPEGSRWVAKTREEMYRDSLLEIPRNKNTQSGHSFSKVEVDPHVTRDTARLFRLRESDNKCTVEPMQNTWCTPNGLFGVLSFPPPLEFVVALSSMTTAGSCVGLGNRFVIEITQATACIFADRLVDLYTTGIDVAYLPGFLYLNLILSDALDQIDAIACLLLVFYGTDREGKKFGTADWETRLYESDQEYIPSITQRLTSNWLFPSTAIEFCQRYTRAATHVMDSMHQYLVYLANQFDYPYARKQALLHLDAFFEEKKDAPELAKDWDTDESDLGKYVRLLAALEYLRFPGVFTNYKKNSEMLKDAIYGDSLQSIAESFTESAPTNFFTGFNFDSVFDSD